jgi:hypothetical protein
MRPFGPKNPENLFVFFIVSAICSVLAIPASLMFGPSWILFVVGLVVSIFLGAFFVFFCIHCVFYFFGPKSEKLTRFEAWVTNGTAVKVMNLWGDQQMAVAYPGEINNLLTFQPWPYTTKAEIILFPNGYVSGLTVFRDYWCIWQPLDKSHCAEMALSYDEYPNWAEWEKMDALTRTNRHLQYSRGDLQRFAKT